MEKKNLSRSNISRFNNLGSVYYFIIHRSSKKDSYITLFWLPILLSKYTETLFADIVEGVCFYLEHLLIQVNIY